MTRDRRVSELLDRHGQTYAEEAGIRLADRPGPLYELHVLATLLSARISAGIATAAARELFAAGCRTPGAMRDASWQERVDALGRGHYRRYDERTSTMLGDAAVQLEDEYGGDLRRLRDEADGDAGGIARRLTRFPGIGPAGASIFLREVQETWPSVAPYADGKMADGARKAGLPAGRDALTGLLARDPHPAVLAAALVRESLRRDTLSLLTR
ncbi:MAG: endonuclease [Streptosporangiales bacterium]|nr:endonuclease [Streptosporangiales bacterium]